LIEVETEDRLGLLYAISQALAGLRVDISTARIVTERGAAMDSFYVRGIAGKPITDPARQAAVEHAMRSAISQLEAGVA
jgi:[protein-PII] uridylyltransferase